MAILPLLGLSKERLFDNHGASNVSGLLVRPADQQAAQLAVQLLQRAVSADGRDPKTNSAWELALALESER